MSGEKSHERNAEIVVPNGGLMINNQWGWEKIPEGKYYHQSIASGLPYVFNGDPHWMWDTDVDEKDEAGVLAFPQILCGQNPISGISSGETLMGHVDEYARRGGTLNLDYDVIVAGHNHPNVVGSMNLLVDSWITATSGGGPDDIVAELMIVLAGDRWSGAPDDFADVGGRTWNFRSYEHPRRGGVRCLVFEYAGRWLTSSFLPIHAFILWAYRWANLRSGYVRNVTLGTEIRSGSGTAIVRKFAVI